MDPVVEEAAQKFVERAVAAGQTGRIADRAALAALNAETGGRMPEWLIALLASVPLCGLMSDWQTHERCGSLEWFDAHGIRSESLEFYPGLAIVERGFLCIGGDPTGSGDPYCIPTDRGEDPPVYQVYHDVGEEADEILHNGLFEVSPRLSDLFRQATGAG